VTSTSTTAAAVSSGVVGTVVVGVSSATAAAVAPQQAVVVECAVACCVSYAGRSTERCKMYVQRISRQYKTIMLMTSLAVLSSTSDKHNNNKYQLSYLM
jgi:siroheme synthase